ncbi:hypothetical protein D3C80_1661030 [compost metagenome]
MNADRRVGNIVQATVDHNDIIQDNGKSGCIDPQMIFVQTRQGARQLAELTYTEAYQTVNKCK